MNVLQPSIRRQTKIFARSISLFAVKQQQRRQQKWARSGIILALAGAAAAATTTYMCTPHISAEKSSEKAAGILSDIGGESLTPKFRISYVNIGYTSLGMGIQWYKVSISAEPERSNQDSSTNSILRRHGNQRFTAWRRCWR